MDFIITFFRDILDGPLYVTVVILNSILICSCIGYLAEVYLTKRNEKKKYDSTHVAIENSAMNVVNSVSNVMPGDNQSITNVQGTNSTINNQNIN